MSKRTHMSMGVSGFVKLFGSPSISSGMDIGWFAHRRSLGHTELPAAFLSNAEQVKRNAQSPSKHHSAVHVALSSSQAY